MFGPLDDHGPGGPRTATLGVRRVPVTGNDAAPVLAARPAGP
jgi:hypothetical protein